MSRATLSAPVQHGLGAWQYPAAPAASASGASWGSNTGVGYANTGHEYLWCYNGGGSAVTATLVFGKTVEGQAVASITVNLPAGRETPIGPLSPSDFTAHDGSGLTYVDFSSVASLYVGLYALQPVQ